VNYWVGLKALRLAGIEPDSLSSSPTMQNYVLSLLPQLSDASGGHFLGLDVCCPWRHKLGGLCSKWEPAWPTDYKVLYGQQWLLTHKEGKLLR
jgi:hypothetical protein